MHCLPFLPRTTVLISFRGGKINKAHVASRRFLTLKLHAHSVSRIIPPRERLRKRVIREVNKNNSFICINFSNNVNSLLHPSSLPSFPLLSNVSSGRFNHHGALLESLSTSLYVLLIFEPQSNHSVGLTITKVVIIICSKARSLTRA